MGPAWTTIWTISCPKAASNETPAGIILIKGMLIMEFPHANNDGHVKSSFYMDSGIQEFRDSGIIVSS
jgi:hypothetical protein